MSSSIPLTDESKWIAYRAKTLLDTGISLEPGKEAEALTKQAARDFFTLASKHLDGLYPLYGFNKCLGVVVVPSSKLVLLAVSQDRKPSKDLPLRTSFLNLIKAINKATEKWVFELVCVPTLSEYHTLLALPSAEKVKPNRRCIEAALMVALCKVGRFRSFTPQEVSVIAFGGHLWATQKGDEPVEGFGGIARNRKHTGEQLKVKNFGWIDVWNPCSIHCAHYLNAMRAVGASGSSIGAFTGPRGEWNPHI